MYDHPPPEGSGIDYTVVDEETIERDMINRELVRTARAATEVKDWLHSLIP